MHIPIKKMYIQLSRMMVVLTLLLVSLTCYADDIQYLKAGIQTGGAINGQPFASGNGDSQYFRIPALFTLDNGAVLAAADARYTTTEDGGGHDTMLCISQDNGETWKYSFPLYFPDSNGYDSTNATTIIDPIIAQGKDGTIYMMADVNPTGVTTLYEWPKQGTGYVDVRGTQCLAVTDVYENTGLNPSADMSADEYPYYVSPEKEKKNYYVIRYRSDGSATDWAVDEYYNLYEWRDNTYAPIVIHGQTNDSETMVQENLFYKDSSLHVYQTGYMLLASSKDYGKTWSTQILNPQIKHEDESALLVSPGRGLILDDGTIVFGFYNMGRGDNKANGTAHASFIYSKDGITWKRTNDIPDNTLENEIVQLDKNTVRMFLRTWNNNKLITYVDAALNPKGEWIWGDIQTQEDAPSLTTCNITAIRYSKIINGKTVILVAAVGDTTKRANGKIYVFLVDNEKGYPMTLYNTFDINEGRFQYACMTELQDGRIALLWEGAGVDDDSVNYDVFDINQILPGDTNVVFKDGDCNGDGFVSISDIVFLQKWLLGISGIKFSDWHAADLYKDNRLDVFDLVLLKRLIVQSNLMEVLICAES